MKLKRNLRAAALGFVLAAVAALSPLGIETATAKTLVYCSEAVPWGFDPALYPTDFNPEPYMLLQTIDASGLPLYNRLVEYERGTTNVIPGLAESWSISGDGKEITFNLRRGVKFHSTHYFTPTRDFNADDVIFSFLRQWKEWHPWHEYKSGFSWGSFNTVGMNLLLKNIRRNNDYTVTFVLQIPFAPIEAILAQAFASILSAEYAAQLEASNSMPNLNTHPIGTGPFQFVTYLPDELIRYKANPNYWNGVQAIDDLIFSITPDASEIEENLKAGDCHVGPYIYPEDVELLRQDPGIIVLEQVGLNISYLAYNTKTPPFDNANVRKALNMAFNKQGMLNSVFRGVAAKNLISPAMWSYNDSTQDDPYDPVAARALLQREGVSNLKMNVWTVDDLDSFLVAELIQADFAAVGVEVEIIAPDFDKYFDYVQDLYRDGAVASSWTIYNGDPQSFFAPLVCVNVGGLNLANWCNEEFDSLIERAVSTRNRAERTRLYEQAQLVFKREAPWATIAHEIYYVPMSAKVIGYKVDPKGFHRFDGVDLLE